MPSLRKLVRPTDWETLRSLVCRSVVPTGADEDASPVPLNGMTLQLPGHTGGLQALRKLLFVASVHPIRASQKVWLFLSNFKPQKRPRSLPALDGIQETTATSETILRDRVDHVTTLAIFKEQRLVENGRGHLYYSVLGESILNDAVAITLFGSFTDLVKSGEVVDGPVALRILLDFCGVFLASTLMGVAGGLATAFLLKTARLGAGACEGEHFFFNVPEIGVALVLAYVPFLAAEACNLSGIVAIMFAGITTRHYAHFNLTQVTRQIFLPTIELIASLCETYVFILLGLGVFLMKRAYSFPLVAWTLLLCLLGRALNVYPLALLTNRLSSGPTMSVKEMHMVWFAGLRGVIAFICALSFPKQEDHQDYLLCTTVILVGASLVFMGWPTTGLLRCLKLDAASEAQEPLAARAPRVSWATMPGSRAVRRASQRLKKLLMTQDAVVEEEMNEFEESNGGTGAAPSAAPMGCMGLGSFDAAASNRGARWSAPGVLGSSAERTSRAIGSQRRPKCLENEASPNTKLTRSRELEASLNSKSVSPLSLPS
ncbi:unnamed protein product [Durusdinium trenchii]|uniref:Cation/H+ exchanger transmembrane domain-containing protein n=1 Tax=Durusdinium trenchii TaxID=1381693 RepID=A0ABP0PWM6_9DINO